MNPITQHHTTSARTAGQGRQSRSRPPHRRWHLAHRIPPAAAGTGILAMATVADQQTARTPHRHRTKNSEKAVITATSARGEHIPKRQLEKSVSWTGRERLRLLWYRLRLTVQEMNYATRRLTELQSRLP